MRTAFFFVGRNFFVNALHEFWICAQKQYRSWLLVLRRREVKDTERDDLLSYGSFACVQDQENIALSNPEPARLNSGLSGIRVHRKPQRYSLRLQFCPTWPTL